MPRSFFGRNLLRRSCQKGAPDGQKSVWKCLESPFSTVDDPDAEWPIAERKSTGQTSLDVEWPFEGAGVADSPDTG